MTETEGLSCAGPTPMLGALSGRGGGRKLHPLALPGCRRGPGGGGGGGRASDRKLHLLALACCRRVWALLVDEGSCRRVRPLLVAEGSRRCVEVAERYADGLADEAEWAAARRPAVHAADQAEYGPFLS